MLRPAFQLEFGRDPTEEELEQLSDRQRNTLLRRNPHIPARVFNRRLEVFLRLMQDPNGLSPFGQWHVEDFFARIEFQVLPVPFPAVSFPLRSRSVLCCLALFVQ